MSHLTRRTILKGAAAGLAAAGAFSFATPSRAAEFSFKLGADWPSDHPSSVQARIACDRVRTESGGRLDIQFFPNNQLGGDTDMLSQVRQGALEMMLIPTGVLSTLSPVAAINNVGMAFDNYDQVWNAMDGALGAMVRNELTKFGLVTMERIWDNGFRQLTTGSKQVNDFKDVQGLKIRVPVSPIFISLWKAFGASPASANINELYTALQTKVFDGQENAIPHLQFYRFYEVQKYCALTSHMWEGFWMISGRKVWGRLPADLQDMVQRIFNEEAMTQRRLLAQFSSGIKEKLISEGMIFSSPDRAPFQEALTRGGFYAEWRKTFGDEAWSLLESSTRKLV